MPMISLNDFADRINEIIPVLMKEFSARAGNELHKGKITVPQFIILSYLEKHSNAKMTELARAMNVTTAAITGIVARLVKSGYVARFYDPKDRRIIMIRLTAKGAKSVRQITTQRRQGIVDVFGMISNGERQSYLKILEHVHEILIRQKAE